MKQNIKFICYRYVCHSDNKNTVTTLFSFYPDGIWDEDKLTIDEAVYSIRQRSTIGYTVRVET